MNKFKCGCEATFLAKRERRVTDEQAAKLICSNCIDLAKKIKYAKDFEEMMTKIKSGYDQTQAKIEFFTAQQAA